MATDLIVIGHEATDLDVLGGAVTEFTEDQYIPMIGTDAPEYEGAYEVTPAWERQTLETANTILRQDVEVNPIQKLEVPNEAGGLTLTI